MDDFVYFSEDDEVESTFPQKLQKLTLVDFMGKVTHFLGIKFQWETFKVDHTTHLKAHLSQSAYVEHLVQLAKLSNDV